MQERTLFHATRILAVVLPFACSAVHSPASRGARVRDPPDSPLPLAPPRAPWLEAPFSAPNLAYQLGRPNSAWPPALGRRLVILPQVLGPGEEPRHFALHLERGVLGPLRVPEHTVWIALGSQDSILVRTAGGEVLHAIDLDRALRGDWQRGATISDATEWDAAGNTLAAAVGDEVLVSTDRGLSFRSTRPSRGASVANLLVTPDDVIVAEVGADDARRVTWISHDQGRTWERSAYQSRSPLVRKGAWVVGCPGVVLARDGRTWSRTESRFVPDPASWFAMLRVDQAGATNERDGPTELVPPPPPLPPRGREVSGSPSCSGSHITRAPTIDLGTTTVPPPDCRGVACLRRFRVADRPPITRTEILLTRSGLRRPEPVDDGRLSGDFVPPAREVSALLIDEATREVRAVPLPDGCHPLGVRGTAGLTLLFCRTDRERAMLYAADQRGSFVPEVEVPLEAVLGTVLLVPEDGTLLLERETWAGPLRAWVRRPLAPGAPRTWRELSHPSAVAYAVSAAGRVAVLTSGSDDYPERVTLLVDAPERPPRTLLVRAELPGMLAHFRLAGEGVELFGFVGDRSHAWLWRVGSHSKRLEGSRAWKAVMIDLCTAPYRFFDGSSPVCGSPLGMVR
jgi:hypothetical protein